MILSPALLSWETGHYNSKFPVFHSEYWVLDSNSAILALAAHLRQAVTQELAATSGKYGEEPAPVYEEDS